MNKLQKKQQMVLSIIILCLAVCFLLSKLLLSEQRFIYSAVLIGAVFISISVYIAAKQLRHVKHGKAQLLMMFLSTFLVAAAVLYLDR